MTLDEMGEALGMSKTTMSTGVRNLTELRMVDKIWLKGTRKDHYQVSDDWHQNFIDFFSLKWRDAVETNMQALRRSAQELNQLLEEENLTEAHAEAAQRSLEKINHAIAYYKWLDRFIDALESHEIFNFIPKEIE